MSVKIYEMAHSPYCIPITATLRACGVPFETVEVPNWDRSEILRLTNGRYYQVPVLVHDEQVIHESSAESIDVARYVDRTFAGGRLFPERLDGLQAIVVEFIENQLEGVTFRLADIHYVPTIADPVHRGMVVRHKERRFGPGCVTQWTERAAEIRREGDALLARFETTLRYSPFIFGDVPVYTDFSLYGVIGNLTTKSWNELSPDQSALVAWRERLDAWRY